MGRKDRCTGKSLKSQSPSARNTKIGLGAPPAMRCGPRSLPGSSPVSGVAEKTLRSACCPLRFAFRLQAPLTLRALLVLAALRRPDLAARCSTAEFPASTTVAALGLAAGGTRGPAAPAQLLGCARALRALLAGDLGRVFGS